MTRCCGALGAGLLLGVFIAGLSFIVAIEILDGEFFGEGF